MISLSYKLSEEEAIRYFEMILRSTKETKVPRTISMMWGPALACVLLIVFKAYSSMVWLAIAISFSLVWIFLISPLMYRSISHTIAKRKLAENKSTLLEIKVKEENGVVTVNDEVKTPKTYFIYYDLLVIGFTDNTNLIIPERVFDKDERLMKKLISDVALYIKDNADKEA